jgi:hypothetical protein
MATGKKSAQTPSIQTPDEIAAAADIAERDHENRHGVDADAPALDAVDPDLAIDERKPEPPKPATPTLEDDAMRDAIAAKRKALLHAADQKAAGEAGDGEADEADEADEEKEAPAAEAAEGKPAETTIELIVDGRRIQKPLSEVIAAAQTNMAADARLEEAKRILNEARNLAAQSARPAADQPPARPAETQADQSGQQRVTKPDPARIASLFDAIMIGDAEAGAKALEELLETSAATADKTSPEEVRALVDAELQRREALAEGKRAIDGLAKDFPEIANDPDLFLITLNRSVIEMTEDMRKIGVPEEELAALGGNPKLTRDAYLMLRRDPQWAPRLRDLAGIAVASAKYVSDKFALRKSEPSPTGPSNGSVVVGDRSTRKAALIQQPRTASIRRPEAEAPATPQPKSRSAIVRAMQADRGQPTV